MQDIKEETVGISQEQELKQLEKVSEKSCSKEVSKMHINTDSNTPLDINQNFDLNVGNLYTERQTTTDDNKLESQNHLVNKSIDEACNSTTGPNAD